MSLSANKYYLIFLVLVHYLLPRYLYQMFLNLDEIVSYTINTNIAGKSVCRVRTYLRVDRREKLHV